jgi:hypothetical protein
MSARVQLVYRVIPAINICELTKVGVPRKEASGGGIVISRPHLHDPRIPVVAVAGRGAELVGGTREAEGHDCIPESIVNGYGGHYLGGVREGYRGVDPVILEKSSFLLISETP